MIILSNEPLRLTLRMLDSCSQVTKPSKSAVSYVSAVVNGWDWGTKFSEDPNVVQPDVVVICDPEQVTDDGQYEGIPTLLMEVLSPATRGRDLITKLELYRRSGIQEYWIVDPEEETITQYSFDERREPKNIRIIKKGEVLESDVFVDLTLDTASLFMKRTRG